MDLNTFLGKRSVTLTMYLMAIICNLVSRSIMVEDVSGVVILSILVAAVFYITAIILSNYMNKTAGNEPKATDSLTRFLGWVFGCLVFLPISYFQTNILVSFLIMVAMYILVDLFAFKVLKI